MMNEQSNIIELFWFSIQYISWYISTAHEELYPDVSKSFLGIDGYHDFHYILSTLGLINLDWLVSGIVKAVGYVIMFYSCFKMVIQGWVEK
ncbi:MAG: hypothetical protein LBS39_00545 [Campylobacteraceae bacterium]|jgi:hypothetical protein|nr:hypothetical protein [Campylobacteraceae bacterium]